jgi:hypothetical protein
MVGLICLVLIAAITYALYDSYRERVKNWVMMDDYEREYPDTEWHTWPK